MYSGLRYAGKIASGLLRRLNVRLDSQGIVIAKGVTYPWHHPSSPTILHRKIFPAATYSPWLSDAEFTAAYEAIKQHTLVDIYRCYELWQLCRQMSSIDGNYLEVGVWRGGTGCLLAQGIRNSDKVVFLADTFAGVVKAGEQDTTYTGGEHADTSQATVRELANTLGLTNVRILKGVFPEDTAHLVDGPIAMLHCDVDVYTSTKEIVQWALPRLSRGGLIVFDDYGFSGCEGVTRLVNEIRDSFLFFHNLNGHAILVKTG